MNIKPNYHIYENTLHMARSEHVEGDSLSQEEDYGNRSLNNKKKMTPFDEYTIRRSPDNPLEASIALNKELIAEIRKVKDFAFDLVDKKDGIRWTISNNIDNEFLPFSLSISRPYRDMKKGLQNIEILTIKNHVFNHNGKFYMFTNHPEGRAWNEYLGGPRFICRLEKFPYTNLVDVNQETKHELARFRGVPVGEAIGLGISDEGHKVKVWEELREIGLFVAASSYLIYSTA